jgi:hypothetical protein
MKITVSAESFGDYKIRLMKEEDAPGVVNLYRTIYGDHYPIKEMYDPQYIIDQQDAGLMYRVLVVDASGKVLAQEALYRLGETYQGMYESGQGMVLREHRAKGFNDVMLGYIMKVLIPAVGVEEWWGETVTNHVFMQKSGIKTGAKEWGIELEIMPADSYEAEQSAKGRVSAVVQSVAFRDKSHTVFLPVPYQEILRKLYDAGKRERQFEASAEALPEAGQTRCTETYIAGAGVLRMTVLEAGPDAEEVIARAVKKYIAAGAVVLQAFLPLDKPWVGALTEVLNRQGFFFSAVMPRWFNADALLLQKLVMPTDYNNIQIYSDFAKDLLQFIIKDRQRVEAQSTK